MAFCYNNKKFLSIFYSCARLRAALRRQFRLNFETESTPSGVTLLNKMRKMEETQ